MKKQKLIPKVTSLSDLQRKAKADPRYAQLAKVAAHNLGGGEETEQLTGALRWLVLNALETSESGVVGEINFVRDLI